MDIRFREREELDKVMPEILKETKPCLKFISEEENELPIYFPGSVYYDSDSEPLPLGKMNVILTPLHFKPMISTGDWVPILQFKVTISDMEFFNEDFKKIFEMYISKVTKRLEYTHFLKVINKKIDDYFRYCNMRNFSYNIHEIEWKD
jgi:hypothetical protein